VLLTRDSPATVCSTLRLLGAAVAVMPPLLPQLQRQGVLSLVRRLATAAAAAAAPSKGKAVSLRAGKSQGSPPPTRGGRGGPAAPKAAGSARTGKTHTPGVVAVAGAQRGALAGSLLGVGRLRHDGRVHTVTRVGPSAKRQSIG
jgi:hypothetical protein